MKPPKPALILDDDRTWSCWIAQGIRRYAGNHVQHLRSVEAFYRKHDIKPENIPALARVLTEYEAIVCDNNFEAQDHEHEYDGWIRGLDFLQGPVGEALASIDEKKKPLLVCFAPSSGELISLREEGLLEQYGIVSFHKVFETPMIAICLRTRQETGLRLNRQQIIEGVLGLEITEDWKSPLNTLSRELAHETESYL